MARVEEFDIAQLREIPFVNASAYAPDRHLSNLNFFVNSEWHCWIAGNCQLHKMIMQPVEADYFGDRPERATDRCYRFLNLVAQRASYPEMFRASRGIWNDIQNLAASLAKLNLFYESSKLGQQTWRFAATEVEYIVAVCRSIFDLLQEMIGSLWERIELKDKSVRKKPLPASFRAVMYQSKALLSAPEITKKYGLPPAFAEWYLSQEKFFMALRDVRDRIAHRGDEAMEIVFSTERGHAIRRNEPIWGELYDWPLAVELPNQLVPLRPLLHSVIARVIKVTDSFADVLEGTIGLAQELYPGLRLFSRGYHDSELAQMEDVLKHSWWCDTRRKAGA